jgi:Swt1-like HEPN
MTKTEDHLRSFGMTGYLVTEDLKALEKQFNVELGHVPLTATQSPIDYYPQFEQEVRIEAASMAKHFEVFYCLERSIRGLITETFQEAHGSTWWESGKIPPNIAAVVKERQQKELESGMTRRSDAAIDYTTFGELSVIITSNWGLFGTVLKSPKAVERVMNNLNMLRGPIAHCCPISEDEVVRLRLTVKDWFRLIG